MAELKCVCGHVFDGDPHGFGPECILWAPDAEATPDRLPPGYVRHVEPDGSWRAVKAADREAT